VRCTRARASAWADRGAVVTQTLPLRKYQHEALDAVDRELASGILRTAVVLPTGTGKTVVFSHLIARQVDAGRRVVVLVHRDELAQQAADKVRSVAPGVTVGIVKAELNEIDAQVLVASVQTLAQARRIEQIDPSTIGVVIVDECHHAVARTWIEALTYFGCFGVDDSDETPYWPPRVLAAPTPAVGFTATMYRDDGRGLGNVWESVAYEREIEWAVEHGHLTDVRGQQVTIDGFDLGQIAKSRGDYQEGKLGDALISIGAGDVVAKAYKEHASIRDAAGELTGEYWRKGVLFAPTVASAYHFMDAFSIAGIPSAVIEGTMSREDRNLIYKRYDAGEIRVLHNCMVLSEGWDSPSTEVCVVARPTQNPALYTQMVGRVLRPFPGKTEALVLDVVGIAGQHRLQSLTTLTKVQVLDGESLSEAQERVAAEAGVAEERERITKAHQTREVELFASSHSVWLQTKAGVWFIPVRVDGRAASVVLWQSDLGAWSVGVKVTGRPGEWVHKGLTFEYALAWGEETANEIDPTIADKRRAWRRTKPSEAQLDLAAKLKLAPVDELSVLRKGALSDLLSIHFASRDLDKALAPRRG
jgi:superfamily II DNA or RNA helicase